MLTNNMLLRQAVTRPQKTTSRKTMSERITVWVRHELVRVDKARIHVVRVEMQKFVWQLYLSSCSRKSKIKVGCSLIGQTLNQTRRETAHGPNVSFDGDCKGRRRLIRKNNWKVSDWTDACWISILPRNLCRWEKFEKKRRNYQN